MNAQTKERSAFEVGSAALASRKARPDRNKPGGPFVQGWGNWFAEPDGRTASFAPPHGSLFRVPVDLLLRSLQRKNTTRPSDRIAAFRDELPSVKFIVSRGETRLYRLSKATRLRRQVRMTKPDRPTLTSWRRPVAEISKVWDPNAPAPWRKYDGSSS